jgi:CubicO group peptidase (beta-lactamase class C family)
LEGKEDMINSTLDKYFEEILFYQDLPGIAAGITIGENSESIYKGLDYKNAFGYKDYITKEKLNPKHVFHMASVTKLFVGTAIMKLVEEGKINLDTKVMEVLPWFFMADPRHVDIRVRDLLSHTAGIGDVQDYGWNKPEFDTGALRRYIESEEVRGGWMLWPPGTGKFQYSNIGYEILGAIISEVSGVSFEEYVTKNIFETLVMNDSGLLTFERANGSLKLEDLSKAGMAMPHIKDKGNHIIYEPFYPYNREHGPSSTLTSNVYDIAKWARIHLDKAFLSAESYEKIWTKEALIPNNGEHVGLSWFIREQNGYTLYGHEGNDDGFRASFWICPELDMHIIIASNITKAPVKKINKSVFDLLTKS